MNSNEIENYILSHSSPEPEVLVKLYRETNLKVLYSRMISGHVQGSLLRMISYMIRPKRILEIGTFTGYSAICLAAGLHDQGTLDTIELNPELEDINSRYFKLSKQQNKIIQHYGNAIDIIPYLNFKYDLIFIDADKENYPMYYSLVFSKLNIGGFILADNVLWDGKVAMNPTPKDKETQGIIAFNSLVHKDHRVENIILPLRDGISIIRKIKEA